MHEKNECMYQRHYEAGRHLILITIEYTRIKSSDMILAILTLPFECVKERVDMYH